VPHACYSFTPLPKKLGIQAGHRVGVAFPPDGLAATLGDLPEGARLVPSSDQVELDVLLLFVRDRRALERELPRVVKKMGADTALWICWPKKTSPLAGDASETEVRERGLAAGLVDVKVCAVDQDWSGHKFVFRLADRPSIARKKARKKK
jgi:hypothetical protein